MGDNRSKIPPTRLQPYAISHFYTLGRERDGDEMKEKKWVKRTKDGRKGEWRERN